MTDSSTGETIRGVAVRTLWLILIAVIIADALDMMDATLTNIAAPVMGAELGGGTGFLKWLGSTYTLAMGVLLVVGGRLGDRHGQRRIFLIGMSGFTIASVIVGLAADPELVLVGRLLQGASGALMIPQGIAIMTATFPREFMRKAFSAFGPVMGLAIVAGPLVGAYLIHANIAGLSWRPMFLVNVVFGLVGLALGLKVLPRIPPDPTVVIDGLAAGLLAATMFGLVYGLIEGPTSGWTPWPLVSISVGLLALAGFAFRQATAQQPLIKPSLFQNRGFNAGLVMGLAFFSVIAGFSYVLSLFMQQGLGRSVIETAVTGVAPASIGIIIAAVVASPLIGRLGRYLILIGLLVNLGGVLWLWSIVSVGADIIGKWSLAGPLLIVGIGLGACFGSLFDIAVGDIDSSEAGSASGTLSAVQVLAGALGSAAITSLWFARLPDGATTAMSACLAVVAGVTIVCCGLVWLLPRSVSETAEPAGAIEERAAAVLG